MEKKLTTIAAVFFIVFVFVVFHIVYCVILRNLDYSRPVRQKHIFPSQVRKYKVGHAITTGMMVKLSGDQKTVVPVNAGDTDLDVFGYALSDGNANEEISVFTRFRIEQ